MAQNRSTMMEPKIEDLLDQVDSKFTLVTLSSKRGRQINAYFNQLGEGLGAIVPPQVTSTARKPLSIALEEIAAGKITYVRSADADDVPAEELAEMAERAEAAERAEVERVAAEQAAGDAEEVQEGGTDIAELVTDDSPPDAS